MKINENQTRLVGPNEGGDHWDLGVQTQRGPLGPGAGTTGTGGRRHRFFAFVQFKRSGKQQERSGKQRETT